MTDNITSADIRGIEGMENFEETVSASPYVKILNSSAALEADLPAGTIINIANKEVLAHKGEEFKFIPIYYFRRWALWNSKTRALEKFTFSKKGPWSDGTAVEFEEMNWHNGSTPPRAQESLEFIVLPVSELSKPEEDQRYCILSIAFTNSKIVKVAKRLEQLIYETCINEKVSKMYACSFSIKSTKEQNDSGIWFSYNDPKFVEKVAEDTLAITSKVYTEVKGINNMQATMIEPQLADNAKAAVPADVTKNTDF